MTEILTHMLKTWATGTKMGEPLLVLETTEGVQFSVLMPSSSAIDLARSLLAEGEKVAQLSHN
jgi:hypothetical protein